MGRPGWCQQADFRRLLTQKSSSNGHTGGCDQHPDDRQWATFEKQTKPTKSHTYTHFNSVIP